MPGERVQLPGIGGVLVCTRGRRARRLCAVCRKRPHSKLCDGRKATGGTCDKPLCGVCAITRPDPKKPGETLDFCGAAHAASVPEQLELGRAGA